MSTRNQNAFLVAYSRSHDDEIYGRSMFHKRIVRLTLTLIEIGFVHAENRGWANNLSAPILLALQCYVDIDFHAQSFVDLLNYLTSIDLTNTI